MAAPARCEHPGSSGVTASKVAVLTPDEIRSWPASVGIHPLAAALGISSGALYKLIRSGDCPVPVLRLGKSMRVTRASVMAVLGISEAPTAAPSKPLTTGVFPQVDSAASDGRSEVPPDSIAA